MFDSEWRPIVDAASLAAGLAESGWRVVDCRFALSEPAAGRRAYHGGHIPGAIYADLDADLAGPVGPDTGRHPLPDPAVLGRTFGRWGIGDDTPLVAYDDVGGAIAARLWWLARWLGHGRVALLDGGLSAWSAAGLPLSRDLPSPAPAVFTRRPSLVESVSTADLVANLTSRRWLVVDARSRDRYAGRIEPIDAAAGHVPGALNCPYTDNLTADLRFQSAERLRQLWRSRLEQAEHKPLVSMCGSGVTACHNLLALEIAGLEPGRLYPGSWSEWIRDPRRPVATTPT